MSTCGSWTQESAQRERNPSWISMAGWTLGFVSGENLMGMSSNLPDFLQGTDASAVWSWLDNYCRANPLDNLGIASDKLVRELLRRKAK
jgi:hypothetical protein